MRQGGRLVAATVVCVVAWALLARTAFEPGGHGAATLIYVIGAVPLGLGWLIAVRAAGNPVGPALAWLAAFMMATPAVELYGELGWPGSSVIAVVGAGAWPWQLVGFLMLLLVFPQGTSARWTLVLPPVAALVLNAAFVVTMNYHEPRPARHSPISVPRPLWALVMFGAMAFLAAVAIFCLGTVVRRYRRGDERPRRQLRWLILGAATVVVLMLASWALTAAGWAGSWAYTPFLLGIVVLVPAAVTVAVLREDLFSIDRLLSASVAWALTTAITAAVLAAAVVGVGHVAGRDSAAGLSGAVFVVALAVLPLHRHVHDAVGKVLDRERTVLLERVRRFVDRVRDGSAEPEGVEEVLREVVGDPGLVLLFTDMDGASVDLAGRAAVPGDGVRVPLRTADTEIGVVILPDATARRIRRARLAASAARLPIEVSRLRLGLRRALRDVDDSRRRLLTVTLAERRRLERDLHDGAQQQLVALGMQVRLLQRRPDVGDAARAELDGAVERIEQTVAGLRRLAHGIRPAGLDDGLAAALRRIGTDSPIPISFAVDDVTPSELVATTAYFVVAEAVTNALKHAAATRIDVAVHRDGDRLRVAVTDDGLGGAEGLTALRDRVGSVGGRFGCTSSPTTGTVVAVDLPWSAPCAS